ncbi:MAG: replication/maintenance protein RepL [Lachnospiraceae bacterium]|nr:replication/maintenance protein RepL [Lachnospiraceae bacterium]
MEKKKLTKLVVNESTDFNTGEIKSKEEYQEVYVENEPDYIKLYIEHICTFNGLKQGISPILLKFCSYLTYAKGTEKNQLLYINITMKEQIAEELGVTVKRINQALTEFINAGIFKKIFDEKTQKYRRGAYIVNPYIIAKGKWKDIKKFRATFDYIEKTIEPQINQFTVEDYIEDETQKEIIIDNLENTLENGWVDAREKAS